MAIRGIPEPGRVRRCRRLGIPMIPVPGTKRVTRVEQNAAALDVDLTADDLAVLDGLATQVSGAHYRPVGAPPPRCGDGAPTSARQTPYLTRSN